MPAIDFQISGVEPVAHGLTPLLHFKLRATNAVEAETVHGVLLHAQIQIQPARRAYTLNEKENLNDLFGTPDRWGQTLRNRLWTHSDTTVPSFSGSADTILPVPCTYDLNISATKYFHALEAGEVSLLFLFSGTIFYAGADQRLQVQQIPWDKESEFRMPGTLWRELMEHHYPNSAWLYLRRDAFDRLCAFKSRHSMATWEEVVERLLPTLESELQEAL